MILFFDTETNGLPKNNRAPIQDIDNWPRVIQLPKTDKPKVEPFNVNEL